MRPLAGTRTYELLTLMKLCGCPIARNAFGHQYAGRRARVLELHPPGRCVHVKRAFGLQTAARTIW